MSKRKETPVVDEVETELLELEQDIPVSVNETSDKSIVVSEFKDVVAGVLNEAQFLIISGRTPRHIIKRRPGKGGKTFSYVPHGYVTATLNKAFGWEWDLETIPFGNGDMFKFMDERVTQRVGKADVITPASVIVNVKLTVKIHHPKDPSIIIARIVKTSVGEKEFVPGMTWGSMVKSAESDGFKKCASRLGIANDLYWQDSDEDYIETNGNHNAPPPDPRAAQAKALAASGKNAPAIAREMGITVGEALRLLK